MPRYKKSPEERAAEKTRRERIFDFVQEMGAEGFEGLQNVYKMMIGAVLENSLEAELEEELGYSKYDYRNKNTNNSRNGHSQKTLKQALVILLLMCPEIETETLNHK